MKKVLTYIVLLGLALAALPSFAADDILSVAVFDFDSHDEAVHDMGPQVATLLNANLSAEPTLAVVERAELEKVLGEHELSMSGTVSPDTAAKVGQMTGAKVLVTGRVFRAGDDLLIVAKIIGTETSRVYGEIVKGKAKSSLSDLAAELAKKIATDISQKASTLVAKVESPEEQIARLKKELGDKKRPSVSVKIAEQHFGQHVIDPAAQTELSIILRQCGFPIVDDASTNHADIDITGEAFSEYGMRKGNLQSCRARIEIKALEHGTGKVIAVDRQTSAGIDLAEHVAAKTALQNGAAQIANRLVPQLAK